MNGILLVDKPAGWTSFDVVNRVRRFVETNGLNDTGKKRFPVGHTGTLDPLATGLLVLLLGSYTKRAPELSKLDKTYDVVMRLGHTSTTGDEEGEKTAVSAHRPTEEEIRTALSRFVGDIMQRPPVYSAIKINGQRAYKLARSGKAPQMELRPAHIEYIDFQYYTYPDVRFATHVSSGTYIRSLVEDAGTALQVGAYMAALRRTSVGPYQLANAISLDELSTERLQANIFEQ